MYRIGTYAFYLVVICEIGEGRICADQLQKINLSVPEHLREQLHEATREEGVTTAECMRQAVEAPLRRTEVLNAQPSPTSKPPAVKALETDIPEH